MPPTVQNFQDVAVLVIPRKAISLYLEPAPVKLNPDEKVFEVEVPV